MTYKVFILPIVLFCFSCTTLGQRQTKVVMPTGEEYLFYLQYDGTLKISKGDFIVEIDNRGKLSYFDKVPEAVLLGVSGATSNIMKNSSENATMK